MSKELPFLIYCIEEYGKLNKMTGKEVLNKFDKYNVCDYIYNFYESLHVNGINYILEDIDDYINFSKTNNIQ